MDDRRRPLMQVVAVLLLAAQVANAAPALAAPAPAAAGTSATAPSGLVIRAQGFYREARYDEAVGLLAGPVLRKELSGQELIDARLVLARCYVKKGILSRAKEHFGAILALDPAFTLDRTRVDADELAVFNEVKGAAPAPVASKPAAPAAKPATPAKEPPATKPATPPATEPAPPQLHKPAAEEPAAQKESWLKKNKYLALGLLVGGGVAIGVAAGGGGGGGGGGTPGPTPLPGFPGVPTRQ